jgi:hypothetical protein
MFLMSDTMSELPAFVETNTDRQTREEIVEQGIPVARKIFDQRIASRESRGNEATRTAARYQSTDSVLLRHSRSFLRILQKSISAICRDNEHVLHFGQGRTSLVWLRK